MKIFSVMFLCFVALLISGCAVGISRTGYQLPRNKTTKDFEPCPIVLKADWKYDTNDVVLLGSIHDYDTGFSTHCDEVTVLDIFTREGCMLGADVINIIKEKDPSIWSSSCYRAKAQFLRLKDRSQVTNLVSDAEFSPERVRVHAEAIRKRNDKAMIGVMVGAAAGGAVGGVIVGEVMTSGNDEFKPEKGYVSLFNGHDLTGWGYLTNDFNGKTVSDDGRFSASDGILIVRPHTPRLIQKIWTTQTFSNDFNLRLEFRAATNADSGIFIRGTQLQCRDYLVAGPYKDLKKYKPQDWNEIEITVTNNTAWCTCNGEVLTNALKIPANGPIGFEGDRGQMEYRHVRLKELK
ncbi:MAG TPA: DUF1080 domain-containing protein [Verrucomicrobiae bacterium]|nr:DUF1080 domain-containing protein [Verrucomicrobiae bacterium]